MERIETESNLPNKFVRMDGIIVARRSGKYSKLFRSQMKEEAVNSHDYPCSAETLYSNNDRHFQYFGRRSQQ